jgi:hypothetical protein
MVHRVVKAKEGVEMAKITKYLLVIAFLMVVVPCFAVNREPIWNSEGKSVFGNVGVTGDVNGAPAYLEMVGANGSTLYYLWVDTDNKLRIATPLAVSYTFSGTAPSAGDVSVWLGATPAQVTWENASGQIVGQQ